MIISLIAAVAANHVIGNKNQLPWHLPADLKHFKQITTGNTIVMGRKTFDSIGKPLPNRRNIVISKTITQIAGYEVCPSLEDAINLCRNEAEIFVIGGTEIFNQAFPLANRIYLTRIDQDFEGDAFFPKIDEKIWKQTEQEYFNPDEKNPYYYAFFTFGRV